MTREIYSEFLRIKVEAASFMELRYNLMQYLEYFEILALGLHI